jgi:hypothetical protein
MTAKISKPLRIEVIPKLKLDDLSKIIIDYLQKNGIRKPTRSTIEGYNSIMQNALATKTHDTDFNIGIIGGRRTGKSNLEMVLLDMFSFVLEKLNRKGDQYMIVKQDSISVRRKLQEIEKKAHIYANEEYLAVGVDEAGKFASKREAMSRKSREFVKLIQIIGAINSTVIYVAPRTSDIDSRLCDPDILHVLLLTINRGEVWMYSSRITDWLNFRSSIQYVLQKQKDFDFISSFISCGTGRLRGKFPPLAVLQVPKARKYESYRHDRVELVKQQLRDLAKAW